MSRRVASAAMVVLVIGIAAAVHADATRRVNPHGLFLEGEGVTVEVVHFLENETDALVRIGGAQAADSGIDGKVLLHRLVSAGQGVDYVVDVEGRAFARLTRRARSGGAHASELWWPGRPSTKLRVDPARSKQLDAQAIFDAWRAAPQRKPRVGPRGLRQARVLRRGVTGPRLVENTVDGEAPLADHERAARKEP